MQVASVAAAGSTCLRAAAHQCPGLAGRIRSNTLASFEKAAVCVGPRNLFLRVSRLDASAARAPLCYGAIHVRLG